MYRTRSTKTYRKAFKRISRHKDFNDDEFNLLIDLLCQDEEVLPLKYKDHQLKGNFKDYRECHIQNDILLVYKKYEDVLILALVNIGSHSELF